MRMIYWLNYLLIVYWVRHGISSFLKICLKCKLTNFLNFYYSVMNSFLKFISFFTKMSLLANILIYMYKRSGATTIDLKSFYFRLLFTFCVGGGLYWILFLYISSSYVILWLYTEFQLPGLLKLLWYPVQPLILMCSSLSCCAASYKFSYGL